MYLTQMVYDNQWIFILSISSIHWLVNVFFNNILLTEHYCTYSLLHSRTGSLPKWNLFILNCKFEKKNAFPQNEPVSTVASQQAGPGFESWGRPDASKELLPLRWIHDVLYPDGWKQTENMRTPWLSPEFWLKETCHDVRARSTHHDGS